MTAIQHLLKVECLLGSLGYASRMTEQHIRREDRTVKPVNHSATSNAADNANIRPRNFCSHLGNEEFRQTKRIGRAGRLFVHCHCRFFPHKSLVSSEWSYCVHNLTQRKENLATRTPYSGGNHAEIESTCSDRGTPMRKMNEQCTGVCT